MKKVLILLLLFNVFSSCTQKRYLYIDDITSSKEDSIKESNDTVVIETSALTNEILETDKFVETVPGWYGYEPIEYECSSYEELEMVLKRGKDEMLWSAISNAVPAAEMFLEHISQEGNLKRPFLNGVPMRVDSARILAWHPVLSLGPSLVYYQVGEDGFYAHKIMIYYLSLEEYYHKDFSSYDSAMDIRMYYNKQEFDPDLWEEKTLQIDGETITAIECKDTEPSIARHIEYYNDGFFVSIVDYSGELTDESLQGFSIG